MRMCSVPRRLAPVLLAVLLAATPFCFARPAQAALRAGDAAPAFTLPDLAGRSVSPADFKGKVVLLHFWASWCSTCVEEIQALEELKGTLGEQGFAPFSVDVGEALPAVESYVRSLRPTYPILLDTAKAVAESYGVQSIPMTFIVDRQGILRYKILGEINRAGLRKLIRTLL